MSAAQMFVIFGAFANIAGSGVYIFDTLKGKTKPNRMTFLLWGIVPFIGVAASLVQGVTWATIPVIVSAICPLAIFAASFINKNAYWRLGRFDYLCGTISILALFLWWLTKEPNLAIVFAILADFVAGIPTLVKAWRHPETETASGYAGAMVSSLSGFGVAGNWTIASIAFPAYLLLNNTALVIGILRGKLRRSV